MSHIIHITSNHAETDIPAEKAAEYVKLIGWVGPVRYSRDMIGGKIKQFANFTLLKGCGTIEIAYASKTALKSTLSAIGVVP